MTECSRPRCSRPVNARGLCVQHYQVWRRTHPPVPAARIAEHLNVLRDAGLGWRRIAEMTGLGFATVRQIPHRRYVLADTAAKILAITPPALPHLKVAEGRCVPALGSARRLQALVALGYTVKVDMVGEVGVSRARISEILAEKHPYVFASTARKIESAFQRLQMQPPPTSTGAHRARLRAERNGWLPPLAWDEDTIDDPNAKPHTRRTSDRRGGFVERYTELRDHAGITHPELVAQRLGISVDSLQRQLERHREAIAS